MAHEMDRPATTAAADEATESDGYRTQAVDTSVEIERVLIAHYRAMTTTEKARRVDADAVALETLALAGLHQRFPDADRVTLRLRLAELRFGSALARAAFGE